MSGELSGLLHALDVAGAEIVLRLRADGRGLGFRYRCGPGFTADDHQAVHAILRRHRAALIVRLVAAGVPICQKGSMQPAPIPPGARDVCPWCHVCPRCGGWCDARRRLPGPP